MRSCAKQLSGLIYSTQAHTLTQADTNSHTQRQRSAPEIRRHMARCLDILAHTLETTPEGSGASRHSQSSNMAPEHPRLHMHTCN